MFKTATPSLLVSDAKWPVYYATGTRALGLAPKANFTASYKTGTAPLTVNYIDMSTYDPTAWEWTFESGNPGFSTSQNPSIAYNNPGTYSVTLKVTNNYGNNTMVKSGYIVVSKSTDVPEIKNAFFVYPNPVKDMLYLNNPGSFKNLNVNIYSLEGRLVKSKIYKNGIDMSNIESGIYIVIIKANSGSYKIKVVKE